MVLQPSTQHLLSKVFPSHFRHTSRRLAADTVLVVRLLDAVVGQPPMLGLPGFVGVRGFLVSGGGGDGDGPVAAVVVVVVVLAVPNRGGEDLLRLFRFSGCGGVLGDGT